MDAAVPVELIAGQAVVRESADRFRLVGFAIVIVDQQAHAWQRQWCAERAAAFKEGKRPSDAALLLGVVSIVAIVDAQIVALVESIVVRDPADPLIGAGFAERRAFAIGQSEEGHPHIDGVAIIGSRVGKIHRQRRRIVRPEC